MKSYWKNTRVDLTLKGTIVETYPHISCWCLLWINHRQRNSWRMKIILKICWRIFGWKAIIFAVSKGKIHFLIIDLRAERENVLLIEATKSVSMPFRSFFFLLAHLGWFHYRRCLLELEMKKYSQEKSSIIKSLAGYKYSKFWKLLIV
jgi:hypothetical protein